MKILKQTIKTFSDTRASQAAASLAYYAIFSLFPLLLVLVAAGSYLLSSEQVYQAVTRFIQNAIPVSPQVINENLKQVLDARGAVGIAGIVTLLWSASGFFTSLAYNINLAWPNVPRRSFLEKRFVGLGMIVGLSGLLSLTLTLSWITNLIPFLNSANGSPLIPGLWRLFSEAGSWLMLFLLFVALYRWVPSVNVRWKANIGGALFSSLAWKLATSGFNWYLRSGLGRYKLVYGSLGAIVALLFLIFIISLIILFGAHLCAAIDQCEKKN